MVSTRRPNIIDAHPDLVHNTWVHRQRPVEYAVARERRVEVIEVQRKRVARWNILAAPREAPKQAVPPFLNFAPLDNALSTLDRSAQRYSKAIHAFARKNDGSNGKKLAALNARLVQTERRLTSSAGLPRRPWFKHLIYAPGFYTGYGAKTLPGIREGIEEKRYEEAETEISRVAQALNDYAANVDRVADELEKK